MSDHCETMQLKEQAADCCKADKNKANTEHSAHAHHARGSGPNAKTAASATVHCLTGCVIGEFIGVALGVQLGWPPMTTITVATILAFITGFALTLIPLMKGRGLSLVQAWKIVWLGETVSIAVMEVAMNFTDYHMGGMTVSSMADPLFWISFGVAMAAGFAAAFPINWWLLSRNLKNCH